MKKLFAILFLLIMILEAVATWLPSPTPAASMKMAGCAEEEKKDGSKAGKELAFLPTLAISLNSPAKEKWHSLQQQSFPSPTLDQYIPPPDYAC